MTETLPRLVTPLVLAGLLATGVATAAGAGAGTTNAPATVATSRPATTVAWRRCADPAHRGFQCGFLTVPLDWRDPTEGTMRIAMIRLRSTGTAKQRIGSLFFNPGGPGGSGLLSAPFVASLLPKAITKRFDFVTWDPRGVNASAGMENCRLAVMEPPATGPVRWTRMYDELRSSQRRVNQDCQRAHAGVISHVGTNMVVRDLDAMRAAVGDRKLTYWGLSYGTRIGYTYALTYPERFRAILLDGSVNPNGSLADFAEMYGTAADTALGMFFQMHRGTARQYGRAHRTLARQPLRLPSGRTFTRWNLRNLLEESAGFERLTTGSWVTAATYLKDATTALRHHGRRARAAVRRLDRLQPSPEVEGLGGAPAAVNCIDYADRPDPAQQDAISRTARLQAPISGWKNGSTIVVQCEGLSLTPDPVPTDFGTDRSARMLLTGSTRDARTPYVWTAAMARAFRASRVVTYTGGQHGDYLMAGSTCVDRAVKRYLLRRSLPRHDIACRNAARP